MHYLPLIWSEDNVFLLPWSFHSYSLALQASFLSLSIDSWYLPVRQRLQDRSKQPAVPMFPGIRLRSSHSARYIPDKSLIGFLSRQTCHTHSFWPSCNPQRYPEVYAYLYRWLILYCTGGLSCISYLTAFRSPYTNDSCFLGNLKLLRNTILFRDKFPGNFFRQILQKIGVKFIDELSIIY